MAADRAVAGRSCTSFCSRSCAAPINPNGERAVADSSHLQAKKGAREQVPAIRESSGPVALFEVDDIRAAHAALSTAGLEIVGALERDSSWEWLHFRAPDVNLYELAGRRADAC